MKALKHLVYVALAFAVLLGIAAVLPSPAPAAESRDKAITQDTTPVASNSVSLESPKSKKSMISLVAVNDRSAGLWVNEAEGKDRNSAAVVGFEGGVTGPYFALYDTNVKTEHNAHQFAVCLQDGKPVIQIAVPGKPIRFIDLDKLADQLIAAEKTAAKK